MPLVLSGDGAVGPLSATEVSYLDGVTSAVQTQIDGKAATPGAWSSWTPVVTQSGNVTVTNEWSKYIQIGKLVVANFRLLVTGSGTGNNIVYISLPVAHIATGTQPRTGTMHAYDASTNTSYTGIAQVATATTIAIIGDWSAGGYFGNSPNIALAVNDQLAGTLIYEAA